MRLLSFAAVKTNAALLDRLGVAYELRDYARAVGAKLGAVARERA